MDANCICVFNEYFEEQIIDEKGKICSYFNFSGAERKNIDLACLFAFMDIRRLQGDVAFTSSMDFADEYGFKNGDGARILWNKTMELRG